MKPAGAPGRFYAIASTLLAGLALAAGPGCGGPPAGGLAIELTWLPPQPAPLRGVLSGIVDTVRVEVDRKGKPVTSSDCDYETLDCQIQQVPAGGGYQVTATAMQAGQPVYRGTSAVLKVKADELTPVAIAMEPAYEQDVYPPAAVTDLAAAATVDGLFIVLTWTATGDDGLLGRANHYLVYWALSELSEDNLADANPVDGPTPRESGLAQELQLRDLPPGQTCYFALKVVDEEGNTSALSNGASASLP